MDNMKDGFDIQVIQPTEAIPTSMKLLVNKRYTVVYREADGTKPGEFAYRFYVYHGNDSIDCDKLVSAIVRKMESQSYDHGAQWRETNRQRVDKDGYTIILVRFYVRDAG